MITSRPTMAVPFAGGVDLRRSKRHVEPPKCLALKNARFPNPGTIAKRFGGTRLGVLYSSVSGTTRSTAAMTAAHGLMAGGDELLCRDGEKLLAYNAATDSWDLRGIMPLVTIDKSPMVVAPDDHAYNCDVARTADGLVAVVGDDPIGSTAAMYVSITDETTGSRFVWRLASSNVENVRVTTVGNTIMVFYVNTAAVRSLYLKTFTRANLPTTATNVLSSPVTVVSADLRGYSTGDAQAGAVRFEVAAYDSTKCLLAYVNNSSVIAYAFCDTAGTLTSTGTETPTAFPDNIAISVAPSGGNWCLTWVTNTTNIMRARIFNSSMTAVIAATTIETLSAELQQLGSVWVSATKVHLVWQVNNGLAGGLTASNIRHGSIDTSAATTAGALLFNASLSSLPWSYGGYAYAVLGSGLDFGSTDGYGFIVRLGAPAGAAVSYPSADQIATIVAHLPIGYLYVRRTGNRLPHVVAGSTANDFVFPVLFSPTPGLASYPLAAMYYTAHFVTSSDVGQVNARRLGGATYLPSGLTWKIDQEGAYEAGLLLPPALSFLSDTISFTKSNSGGSLTNNQRYLYRCYWEWVSASGEIERSATITEEVSLGATDNTVTIQVLTMPFTNKSSQLGLRDIGLAVYRAKKGSNLFRRVSSYAIIGDANDNGYTLNNRAAGTISFVDKMADTTAATKELDYLSEGELDNVAPPACKASTISNGRLFVAGFPHDPNLIWYSKIRQTLEDSTDFSDFNTIYVQAGDGPITALASLSDSLIVFRRHQVYVIGGEGPGNGGTGGEFVPARTISDDIGCDNQASIVRGPQGLFFQSAKGIFLLGPDFGLTFIGGDVASLTDLADVTSAVAAEAEREIRFTVKPTGADIDGFTQAIVYHYDVQAWSTWDYPSKYGSCMWRGSWVAQGDLVGSCYKLTADQYHDNSTVYTRTYESAWIRTTDLVQGYQRVLRVLLAGQYKAGHKVRVKIAYDYLDTWVDNKLWTPTVTDATGNYQLEVRPSREICQAIKIYIADEADGVNPLRDSFNLSEMALELGVYSGPGKIASDRIASS